MIEKVKLAGGKTVSQKFLVSGEKMSQQKKNAFPCGILRSKSNLPPHHCLTTHFLMQYSSGYHQLNFQELG